jgi:hypothetical protein
MPLSMLPSGEKQSHSLTQFYREPGRQTIHLVPNVTNRAADFCLEQRTLSPVPPAGRRAPWAFCHYRSIAARLACRVGLPGDVPHGVGVLGAYAGLLSNRCCRLRFASPSSQSRCGRRSWTRGGHPHRGSEQRWGPEARASAPGQKRTDSPPEKWKRDDGASRPVPTN